MANNSNGTIRIDNKSLLDDLLFDNNGQSYHNFINDDSLYHRPLPTVPIAAEDPLRIYAETPTFAKEEEDLYRWVYTTKKINAILLCSALCVRVRLCLNLELTNN